MLTFKKTTVYLLFLSGVLSAQLINGKVISKENNEPISFAKIGIENENFGVIADEKGNYSIDLTPIDRNKKIIIQNAGYQNFSESVERFIKGYPVIALSEKVVEIEKITLVPKKYSERNWGTSAATRKIQFGFNPERSNEDRSKEIGVFFRNNKKVKIQKINLNVIDLKTDQSILVSFNIYSEKEGMPYQSLLNENLTVKITKEMIKDETLSFDFNDKNIWIDKQDFFVSMQVMNAFKGRIYLSGAMLKSYYFRQFYGTWKKNTIAQPAINIDVKIEK